MSELEDLRRRSERRTEAQLAATRKKTHEAFERLRQKKDRGGSLFEPTGWRSGISWQRGEATGQGHEIAEVDYDRRTVTFR
ncbi:MAG: hypothetical protein KAI25_11725 [Hyphomicrobiaceae bacterium]|nr:hypothetical protein [Hyphomicrobiaceae bacterium]